MTTDYSLRQSALQAFDFTELFIEGLFWDNPKGSAFSVDVNGFGYTLTPVSQKSDFAVFECSPDAAGNIPDTPTRRRIDTQVARIAYEHIIIFVDEERTNQTWQWVKREGGKALIRQISYREGQTGAALLQRLEAIGFALDEEQNLGGVTGKVKSAFDVERVTKRFYDRFQKELTAFQSFIEGMTAQGDREWYASLMLNRMMFVYFIQKQGFLDRDTDYLRNRLRMVQESEGEGRYQQFYRIFLLRLFHEGLGQPESERKPELARLLGNVPFLNGGLFDLHDLERDNPDISIPDAAFEQVFDFFDNYQWHLDDRPNRADNEINPDVLGYIFEKYINQKQMGAYYTKEDITGYITRNTVIPFLFDFAMKECPVAFTPDGGVWRLLQDDPDRYIYPAVGHGIVWAYSADTEPTRLDAPLELPARIAAGVDDVSMRGDWNEPADDGYALPTETWREVVARRKRYEEIRAKLAAGEVQNINDLITLNLDVERFAKDVLEQSEGPELLRAFWHGLNSVSVLDPACGSGAFLFAALNILEPLYTACLEGMEGFRNDLELSSRPHHPNALRDFRLVLDQLEEHPSQRYFVLKSIVLNNLYGVDIMEEATEICKLRLFLKLVAQLETYDQIEPLPDIDFNIRAGNTLVGFTSLDAVRDAMTITPDGQHRMPSDEDRATLARIEEDAEIASRAFERFREQQTTLGGEVTVADKENLRDRLRTIRDELDQYFAAEYGVQLADSDAYEAWRASHRPFHWFVEFYGVMQDGGFDVIVGNPPYVKYKSLDYAVNGTGSFKFPDIYAYVVIQSYRIKKLGGRCGFILPLSLSFSFEFADLRKELTKGGTHWLSSYDNIPAALFAGVGQRCTILISTAQDSGIFSTRLLRWRAPYRHSLMSNIAYSRIAEGINLGDFGIPRIIGDEGKKLLDLHIRFTDANPLKSKTAGSAVVRLGFSPTARNFISTYLEKPPTLSKDGIISGNGSLGSSLALPSRDYALAALASTSGSTCFWYWLTRGDGFHVTNGLLTDFLAPLAHFPMEYREELRNVGELLHEYRYSALVFKKNAGKYVGNYNYQTFSSLTLRADLIFLAGLGATWHEAEGLLSLVSLVRSVNQAAGEKNIPKSIKNQFPQSNMSDVFRDERLAKTEKWLSNRFDVEPTQITMLDNA